MKLPHAQGTSLALRVQALWLGFLNVVHFVNQKSPWGVTGYFAHWGAWVAQKFGAAPQAWEYYAANPSNFKALENGFLKSGGSWMDLGIVAGAFIAALLASQFRIKKVRNWKQATGGIIGGLLMGYGARIGFGGAGRLNRPRCDSADRFPRLPRPVRARPGVKPSGPWELLADGWRPEERKRRQAAPGTGRG